MLMICHKIIPEKLSPFTVFCPKSDKIIVFLKVSSKIQKNNGTPHHFFTSLLPLAFH
jgi:hypothetical protein